MDYFTLHIRLTKGCNAHCDYCSSDDGQSYFMGVENFKKSINYISKELIPTIAPSAKHLTIQYVGGEITTIPNDSLNACVNYARKTFSEAFDTVIDGAQSNLISSKGSTKNLFKLFGENIGTSIDGVTGQRKINGSSERYDLVFNKNIESIKKEFKHPPSIFVVDKAGLKEVSRQIRYCELNNTALTLRPVFSGSSPTEEANRKLMYSEFLMAFKRWFLRSNISVEPFTHLVSSRLKLASVSCPFQSNCARVSLNLEPNGDLFTCLDMADSKQHKLGNALNKEFFKEIWRMLDKRGVKLPSDCLSCDYLSSCQGGCMSEAIHHSGSVFGKTEFCELWKSLFCEIDQNINIHGSKKIRDWLRTHEEQ